MHAAEGELYREALAEACAEAGLSVTRAPRKELTGLAAAASGSTLREFEARLTAAGKALGPPWQADHRLATAAAWLGLASRRGTLPP
jgi:hypothetical protein